VTECAVKALRDVKVTGSKPAGTKKSIHVKGWCGSGRVRSPGDFDGLDALESWFLSHRLIPHVTDKLTNKKKKSLTSISMEVRDEGYSPSPNTGIDEDEGYSPSHGSISISRDQNSMFRLSILPRTREFLLSSLHSSSQMLPLSTMLPFLPSPTRLCVARIPPSVVRSRSPLMGSLPHPSLTLKEALPTYHPDGNSILARGLF
jgi:hypothetical protein